MNNSTTNQVLIELEENLKSLESARTQVNSVSQKSEHVINSFKKIAIQVEALHQQFEFEKKGLTSAINKSLKNFDKHLVAESENISLQIKGLNQSFSSNVSDSIKRMIDLANEIEIKHDSVNASIKKGLENYNQILQKNSEDVSVKTGEQINYFYEVIHEISQELKAFEKNIDSVSQKILSLDYEVNFKELKSEIINLQERVSLFVLENNQNYITLKDHYDIRSQALEDKLTENTITIEEQGKLTSNKNADNFKKSETKLLELGGKLNEQDRKINQIEEKLKELLLEQSRQIKQNKVILYINIGLLVFLVWLVFLLC